MKSSIAFTRLLNEEKNIKNPFKALKIKGNIRSIAPCQLNSRKDLFNWEILIEGRVNSLWEGGIYIIKLQFTEEFPLKPPKAFFNKGFLHVHVYEDGDICTSILTEDNWKNFDIITIANYLEELIHQDPVINSPANDKLKNIYCHNQEKYNDLIKLQANYYKNIEKFERTPTIDYLISNNLVEKIIYESLVSNKDKKDNIREKKDEDKNDKFEKMKIIDYSKHEN